MATLRYFPGQVVGLRKANVGPPFEQSYAATVSEIIRSIEFKLAPRGEGVGEESMLLDLHLTAPGEEFRLITQLQRREDFISASPNFLGQSQATELGSPPGAWGPPEACFFVCRTSEKEPKEIDESELPHELKEEQPDRVAAIDVEPGHCKRVMHSILEGFESCRQDSESLEVVGLSLKRDIGDFVDLHGFSELLLRLSQFQHHHPIQAINMSVDYSVVCTGHDERSGVDLLPPQISLMCFSFPFFERILQVVRDNLTLHGSGREFYMIPAFFAAAGNRMKSGLPPRCRLAYPAVRPETIAATYVTQTKEAHLIQPHDSADLPSAYDLKPCVGLDPNALAISEQGGTSFASAWLTGAYMAISKLQAGKKIQKLGPLSKIGSLLTYTNYRKYDFITQDPKASVSVFDRGLLKNENTPLEENLFNDLIVELNESYGVDFAVTGSMATVATWLSLNRLPLTFLYEGGIAGDLADIDLVYAGSLGDKQKDAAKEIIRDFLRESIGRRWIRDSPFPVHLHSMEGRISAAQLLQCIVPVSHMFLTAGGLIDVWGGREELCSGSVGLILLEELKYWLINPYFLNGANCMALGILHWLNVVMLLNLLASRAGNQLLGYSMDSMSRVRDVLQKCDANDSLRALFGGGRTDPRERLLRRLDRTEHLFARNLAMKIECEEVEWILERIKNLHINFEERIANLQPA